MQEENQITNVAQLRELLGEPLDFIEAKVEKALDDSMCSFIRSAPLVFVSTLDSNGLVDTSPKGDPAGFVQIDEQGNLLIPERPGNKLAYGFVNLLANPQMGLIFVVPGMRETLRVKGTATLHTDPQVLESMAVNGKPALLCTRVQVQECFFHCGKAMIRSKLWQPDSWSTPTGSPIAAQLAKTMDGDAQLEKVIESELEKNYVEELY